MFLYFMAFVDRGNLVRCGFLEPADRQGNAKLQGLQQDVLESSSRYYQVRGCRAVAR